MKKKFGFSICISLSFLFFMFATIFFLQGNVQSPPQTLEKDIVEIVETKRVEEFETKNDIKQYNEQNELLSFEEDGEINFYNKFALKSLLVLGEFDTSSFENVEKVDNFSTTLRFESEQETKEAYLMLQENDDIKVFVNQIISNSVDYTLADDPIGWGYETIGVADYWTYLEDNSVSEEVVVVVMDTGINTSHIKLKDRILKDGSGNLVGKAYINTIAASSYLFEDDEGHGTHVSGIVCDTTPDNVKILPMKILDSEGKRSVTLEDYVVPFVDVASYAQTYNIVAVNMSFGGECLDSYAINFVDAYLDYYLCENDILPVAAAGNESTEINGNYLPASCPSATTVSALKSTADGVEIDEEYSNYGADVDISAPGTLVRSSYIGSSTATAYASGTSMASPYVAAVVSLLYLDPIYLGAAETEVIRDRLYKLAIDLGDPNWDPKYGIGAVSLVSFDGDIDFTAESKTYTYDGNYHNISVTVNDAGSPTITYGFSSSEITITDITQNNKFKNWTDGPLAVYFKISLAGKTDTIGVKYLQINKCEIGVEVNEQTSIYGNNHTVSQTAYTLSQSLYGSDVLGASLSCSIAATSPSGEYDISFSYTNTNYLAQVTKSEKYKILPRPISIGFNDQEVTYGENFVLNGTYQLLSGEIKNGDNLSITTKTDATNSSPVGNYDIELESGNSNYDISWTAGNLAIKQRNVEVSISQTGTYGDEPSLNKDNFSIVSGSVKAGDSLFTGLTTTATRLSPIGDYPITIVGTNGNYNITCSTKTYKIEKRNLTINVADATSEYGEELALVQTAYSLVNLANEDDLMVVLSTDATKFSNATTYDINADFSANNYNVTVNKGTYTITPRSLSIRVIQSFVYGEAVVLDETDFEDVANRIVNGDNLSLDLSTNAVARSSVGDYEISIDDWNRNYNITLTADSKITISPKSITVGIGDKTIEYGETLDEDEIVIDTAQVLNGDNLNYVLCGEFKTASAVGDYEIDLTYNNANYTVTVDKGTLYIEKRDIAILVEVEVEYGEEVDLSGVAFDDVNNKLLTGDDLELVVSTTAERYSHKGTYDVTLVSNNSNYDVLVVAQSKVEITPRKITITLGNASSVYREEISLDGVSIDKSEIVNNDELNIVLTTTATNTARAKKYPISLEYNNQDYDVTIVMGEYTIERKEVKVTVGEQRATYGEVINFSENNYQIETQNVPRDDLGVVLACEVSSTSGVGRYDIDIFSYSQNYILIDYQAGSFHIDAREILIDVQQQKVYGEDFVFNGRFVDVNGKLIRGDELGLVVSTTATKMDNVGEYHILIEESNPNYNVILTGESKLSIIPRTINVSVGNVSKIYLDEVDLSGVSLDLSEVFEGDVLDAQVSTVATRNSPVGEYEITARSGNSNYAIKVISGKLQIKKRIVFVSVSDYEEVYGTKIAQENISYVCMDRKVQREDLAITFDLEKGVVPVGEYGINVKSYDKQNFELTFSSGLLTITPRKLVVCLTEQTQGHFAFSNPDQKAFKVVSGEVVKGDDLEIEISFKNGYPAGYGECELTACCNNKNYQVEFKMANLNVVISGVDGAIIAVISAGIITAVALVIIKAARKRKIKRGDFF